MIAVVVFWKSTGHDDGNATKAWKLQNVCSKGVDDSYCKCASLVFKTCISLSYRVHCIGVFVLVFNSLALFQ